MALDHLGLLIRFESRGLAPWALRRAGIAALAVFKLIKRGFCVRNPIFMFATLFFPAPHLGFWIYLEVQVCWMPLGKRPVMAAPNPCEPRGASEFLSVVWSFALGVDSPHAELPCSLSPGVSVFSGGGRI